jgi:transcriptional regulator with XRE-family HTH domain
LGERLARIRLEKNLTQAQLAEQAGVSKRTVERMESGGGAIQLTLFIRLCRALGIVEAFELLVPGAMPSPIERVKQAGRARRRASAPRKPGPPPKAWEWGDES